jgi:hypothetical protein
VSAPTIETTIVTNTVTPQAANPPYTVELLTVPIVNTVEAGFLVETPNPWTIYSGSGTPNGVQTGTIGDMYVDRSGGAASTLYVKESGVNTNTGWVAK